MHMTDSEWWSKSFLKIRKKADIKHYTRKWKNVNKKETKFSTPSWSSLLYYFTKLYYEIPFKNDSVPLQQYKSSIALIYRKSWIKKRQIHQLIHPIILFLLIFHFVKQYVVPFIFAFRAKKSFYLYRKLQRKLKP